MEVADRVPAEAGPVCEQRMRISRRDGEKTLANDMIAKDVYEHVGIRLHKLFNSNEFYLQQPARPLLKPLHGSLDS
jgi:hypothetical protein